MYKNLQTIMNEFYDKFVYIPPPIPHESGGTLLSPYEITGNVHEFKSFIELVYQAGRESVVGDIEEMKKPLQEKHDKLKEQYNLAYRKWFYYEHRGEKLESELKSFETGTSGNVMADCYSKLEALTDVITKLSELKK